MRAPRGSRRRQGGFIYLRTGGNGSCKTLFTLKDVRQLQLETKRPVYFVEGRFKPRAILLEEFGWKPFQFKEWQSLPDGSILLCDEVHYDLPVRSSSAPVPEYISKITEHRARGFDFFMMTQHPGNMDLFVRRLVQSPGYHQHLKRVFGASNATRVLQWDAVNMTCEKDGSGKAAQIITRVQPKEVFDWYESAMLHTGKRRIPKQVWYFVGAVVLAVGCAWFTVHRLVNMGDKAKADSAVQQSSAGPGMSSSGGDRLKPMTAAEYVASYQPRIPSLMHTAPAYDKLTEPKRVPVPAACIEVKRELRNGGMVGCRCYTQDATPYPVDLAMCRQLVAQGAFLAFKPEGEAQASASVGKPPVAPDSPAAPALAPAPSGLIVIDGGGSKSPGAPTTVAASAAPDLGSQPRVRPGSPWSFQTQ